MTAFISKEVWAFVIGWGVCCTLEWQATYSVTAKS